MQNKHAIILLVLTMIICSCSKFNQNNFCKRKFTDLKPIAVEESQSTSTEEKNPKREFHKNSKETHNDLNASTESFPDTSISSSPDLKTESTEHKREDFQSLVPLEKSENEITVDEGEDEYKYEKKSRRFTKASYALIWTSGIIMLVALGLILLVLSSGASGIELFIILWVLTCLFIPSMVAAGLSLHFIRKSIQYDKLDRRETTKKQRVLLWMSFFFILASAVPFLVMLNYG